MVRFDPPLTPFERRFIAIAVAIAVPIGLLAGYGYGKLLLGMVRL